MKEGFSYTDFDDLFRDFPDKKKLTIVVKQMFCTMDAVIEQFSEHDVFLVFLIISKMCFYVLKEVKKTADEESKRMFEAIESLVDKKLD